MKIEMDGNTTITTSVVALALVLITLIISVSIYTYKTNLVWMDKGYIEVQNQGKEGVHWTKPQYQMEPR